MGLLTGRVGYRDEREVKVVQIHFALCLEFVEEVEQTKRKGGARAGQRCWEQPVAKELATAGTRV